MGVFAFQDVESKEKGSEKSWSDSIVRRGVEGENVDSVCWTGTDE
jgi:hypothetical protein